MAVVATCVLAAVLGGTPAPPALTFYVTSGSCPLAWTRVPLDKAECGQGALQEGLATTADPPVDLTIADSLLIRPKAELPRGCLVIDSQLYWNAGGSDVAGELFSITVICTVIGPEPPKEAPVFVLPPFLAPWDYTKTATLQPPMEPPAEPTPTLTIEEDPTPTVPVTTGTPGTTSSPARGPVIVDVTTLSQTDSGAGCVEWSTLNTPDASRRASSTYYPCTTGCAIQQGTPGAAYHKGRLDDAGWVGANRTGQWYELDAEEVVLMSGVVLQGGVSPVSSNPAWASGVSMLYSADRATWSSVEAGKVFVGSRDTSSKVAVRTDPPFPARYMRINVETWVEWVALRAGVLQCTRRAISVGGLQIRLNQATNLGSASTDTDTAFEVLRLFGISGSRQTLGNPEGFSGRWLSPTTYLITLTPAFNGRIDPLLAGVYIAETANITSVGGDPATQVGEQYTMPFSTSMPAVSPLFADPGPAPVTPPSSDSDGSSDFGFVIAAVIIIAVIICCIIVWYCAAAFRRSQETERHSMWIENGRRDANIRMPGGVSSAFKHHPPPRDEDEYSLAGSVLPDPGTPARNPILYTFPPAERRIDV